MKNFLRVFVIICLCYRISFFSGLNAMAEEILDEEIIIDGYYDDWSDKPYSWEYNWDNPWKYENHWNGKENVTLEYEDENGNPYNIEIRHKMSLFTDYKNAYVHIVLSTQDQSGFHDYNYIFQIDGQEATFYICFAGGETIAGTIKQLESGNYPVEIRHANNQLNGSTVEKSEGILTIKEGAVNNEFEIKIPLASMKQQNDKINSDNVKTISFSNPNYMYRSIVCTGTATAPYLGIVISLVAVFGMDWVQRKRKGRKNI